MYKQKVIIVDDHHIFRDGLKLSLGTIKSIEVVNEAKCATEFLNIIKNTKIDIAFMDIRMPDMNGIEATIEALKISPDLKIIIMSSYDDIEIINNAIIAGTYGYLLKNADYKDIINAIETVSKGKKYFSHEIIENITSQIIDENNKKSESENTPNYNLTFRETQVLKELCNGDDSKLIAKKLNISERTVEKHIQNILSKTNIHTTTKLIVFCLKNKLV
jgi:DNA-binding NarL/FixJ family response regulator